MSAAPPTRVYLCSGDGTGWAVDEDRRLTAMALARVATLVPTPPEAEVIHACWWEPLMALPADAVRGRAVVCHMAGDPARVLSEPRFRGAVRRVTTWIAQSRGALEKLRTLGLACAYVPYAIDPAWLHAPGGEATGDAQASAWASGVRARLPEGAYVIANFHRDTAGPGYRGGGVGNWVPKLVKGPDLFVEILAELRRRGRNVAALLAGPRRHWVRERLRERAVPYAFAGHETPDDDYPGAILPAAKILALYRGADLCLVTSRSEGGPRAVLEASALGVPVLSTPVGLAPDVLSPECLYTDVVEAVEKIEADIESRAGASAPDAGGTLARFAPAHREIVRARHTPDANVLRFVEVYANAAREAAARSTPSPITSAASVRSPARVAPPRREGVVSFWNNFTPPPWGGGNQFMMALMHAAQRRGVRVAANGQSPGEGRDAGAALRASDFAGHIVNSVQFPIDAFERLVEPGSVRVVHRIDGPISTLRGTPESLEQDRRCFDFNARYASATVIQSWHTLTNIAALGFDVVNPVLVLNACDPAIFRRAERLRRPGERLRVIATSWSPSPGKGAPVYEWLDRNLDFERFDVTFVGNCPVAMRRVRVVEPQPSERLADLLREHDVYLTASRNDPCSNALIEGLACGLPAVYLDSGGHPELAGLGGVAFRRPSEIPAALERIRRHYDVYRNLIVTEPLDEVCDKYLALLLDDRVYQV
ncbi:MAG: glycosyltransferase [Planctomycetota bacterium]|nr:glycosyltransferase [Planctomycetota bacterium]